MVSPGPRKPPAPITLGQRSLAALAILTVVASICGGLGAAGVLPLPASLASLSRQHLLGRLRVVVGGYYITEDFVSLGGPQLPPYVFAVAGRKGAPAVHVMPTLPDVVAGKVAAVIDTATGDGSSSMPYQIHTLARWDSFVAAVVIGPLIALAFAFWLAGPAVALVRRRG